MVKTADLPDIAIAVYRQRKSINQSVNKPCHENSFLCFSVNEMLRRDVPVGVPLDLSTPVMEWHELPKYNGIQVSQLIYEMLNYSGLLESAVPKYTTIRLSGYTNTLKKSP